MGILIGGGAPARRLLELGDASTKNVGTTSGTIAAGDDPRFAAIVPVIFPANFLRIYDGGDAATVAWDTSFDGGGA